MSGVYLGVHLTFYFYASLLIYLPTHKLFTRWIA